MIDPSPPITYLEYLRAELELYTVKRAKAAHDLRDQPEYAACVDKMWQHAISANKARIAREEADAPPV